MHVTRYIGSPCVIMELTPHTAIVPASVAPGNDKLVTRKLLNPEAWHYCPIAVLKRTERHSNYVFFRVEIVVGAYLVIHCLVKIRTSDNVNVAIAKPAKYLYGFIFN